VAATTVKKIQSQQEAGTPYLRVGVKLGGPTGFLYDLRFDSTYSPKLDYLGESGGVAIVVDRKSAIYLEGATIDFTTENGERGFKFHNPNAVDEGQRHP
jgi:iron-sulfur cluster assembly protein